MNPTDPLHGLPIAQPWSIHTGDAGRDLIAAGIALFVLSVVLWIFQPKKPALGVPATICFVLGCLGLFGAIFCLGDLFVNNQFQYEYVYQHSDVATDLKYKIASIWTAQQGSFLLWACTSALFGLLTIRGTGQYRRWYVIAYSAFLASLCGILNYETPFKIMSTVVRDGHVYVPPIGSGMVPSLQNYWVVIHPPTIFTGFGSLTVMFAYAVAAMMTGDALDWARRVRPWTLVSVAILGLGLCMGGLWAYETQGWGGFWAWDPVENVSFVPWIFSAALIHGVIVQVTKKRWIGSNLLLAGLPFLTFVYGTFLTRSGLLDKVSVHSFASMDKSALVVLRGFLWAVVVLFAGLWFWRGLPLAKQYAKKDEEPGLQRESLYRIGVLLLSLLAAVVTLGMSWPVITALRGGQGSKVEEWLYHLVVVWFFIPIMILVAVAPFASWRPMALKDLWAKVVTVASVSVGLTGFAVWAIKNPTYGVHAVGNETVATPFGGHIPLLPWMAVLIFLCVFAGLANLWRAIDLSRRAAMSTGGFIAHLGLAVLLGGLIVSRGFEQHDQQAIQPGDSVKMLDYTVAYKGIEGKDSYDRDGHVLFDVTGPDGQTFVAKPGLYYYDGDEGPKPQVWPHVEHQLSHDTYLSLHAPVIDVWEQPQMFQPNETRTQDGVTVTYKGMTMQGEPGMMGTRFLANVTIQDADGQQWAVQPYMQIGSQDPPLVPVGKDFFAILERMDAGTHAIQLRLLFQKPIYPVELFYKPMTGLVWLGMGILTFGGLMSAFQRRVRGTAERRVPAAGPDPTPLDPTNAPVPAT